MRQTLVFEDAHSSELAKIQERMLRVKDSMEVEGAGGQQVAMVKKALISVSCQWDYDDRASAWIRNCADRRADQGECEETEGCPPTDLGPIS